MDKVQSIQNQSQIPKNGQASGKFSDSGPSNPQNSDRLWADFGPSNPQNRGQPYIGASGGLPSPNLAVAGMARRSPEKSRSCVLISPESHRGFPYHPYSSTHFLSPFIRIMIGQPAPPFVVFFLYLPFWSHRVHSLSDSQLVDSSGKSKIS